MNKKNNYKKLKLREINIKYNNSLKAENIDKKKCNTNFMRISYKIK
jgi:hypothetical protein